MINIDKDAIMNHMTAVRRLLDGVDPDNICTETIALYQRVIQLLQDVIIVLLKGEKE